MTNIINGTEDVLDSRDIIERIEELQSEYDEFENESEIKNWAYLDEYTYLTKLAEQGEEYSPDWEYGSQLIKYEYFEQAMDEMVEDCYGDQYSKDLPSFMTITLDYVALMQDYTEIDLDGQTYLIR